MTHHPKHRHTGTNCVNMATECALGGNSNEMAKNCAAGEVSPSRVRNHPNSAWVHGWALSHIELSLLSEEMMFQTVELTDKTHDWTSEDSSVVEKTSMANKAPGCTDKAGVQVSSLKAHSMSVLSTVRKVFGHVLVLCNVDETHMQVVHRLCKAAPDHKEMHNPDSDSCSTHDAMKFDGLEYTPTTGTDCSGMYKGTHLKTLSQPSFNNGLVLTHTCHSDGSSQKGNGNGRGAPSAEDNPAEKIPSVIDKWCMESTYKDTHDQIGKSAIFLFACGHPLVKHADFDPTGECISVCFPSTCHLDTVSAPVEVVGFDEGSVSANETCWCVGTLESLEGTSSVEPCKVATQECVSESVPEGNCSHDSCCMVLAIVMAFEVMKSLEEQVVPHLTLQCESDPNLNAKQIS